MDDLSKRTKQFGNTINDLMLFAFEHGGTLKNHKQFINLCGYASKHLVTLYSDVGKICKLLDVLKIIFFELPIDIDTATVPRGGVTDANEKQVIVTMILSLDKYRAARSIVAELTGINELTGEKDGIDTD